MSKIVKKKTKPTDDDTVVVGAQSLDVPEQKQVELTTEGFDELTSELKELTNTKLPQVIDRVAKAREYGDLSENSEYHSARDEQQLIETRIDEIQAILNNSKIVKQTKSHDKVGIGSRVTLADVEKKNTFVVHIVGEFESTPGENKISSVSPMGKAIMGKKKGDKAVVKAPAGETVYEIKEIE
ncbi:transcription elongation factor GreA [Candidatus Woesebacteria bacterium]|nr:transcription elongation factor GreA [Candidatus Woesebacteria bacterium]